MYDRCGWGRGWSLATALLVVAGCADDPTAPVPDAAFQLVVDGGVVFMTQNVDADVRMEALFQGPLALDAEGCLRLDGEGDDPTVVWPLGYTLAGNGSDVVVRDAAGDPIGEVGSEVRVAGGEVPELTDAMGFTAEDREDAARCPGRYWIANPE